MLSLFRRTKKNSQDTKQISIDQQALQRELKHWHGSLFTDHHTKALNYLIKVRHMTIHDAVEEIQGLTWEQANGIARGLARHHVLGLQEYQIQAYLELGCYGLTTDELREWKGLLFTPDHTEALRHLICNRHMRTLDAVHEICDLDIDQASAMAAGMSRKEVIELGGARAIGYLKLKK